MKVNTKEGDIMKYGKKQIGKYSYYTVTYKGKTLYSKNKKDLKVKLDLYVEKVKEREQLRLKKDIRLSLGIKDYLEKKVGKVKPTSFNSISNHINKMLNSKLSNYYISDITTGDLDSFINNLKLSYSSKKTVRIIYNNMFDYFLKERFINYNPVKGVEINKPKVVPEEPHQWKYDDVKDKIMDSDKYKLELLLLLTVGCRIGELRALTKSDFNTTDKSIRINKTYARYKEDGVVVEKSIPPKTSQSIRTVYYPQELDELIESRLKYYKPNQRLFTSTVATYNNQLKKLLGKDAHVHMLRSLCITNMVESNIPTDVIQRFVGHEIGSSVIYKHYYKPTNNRYKNIIEDYFR